MNLWFWISLLDVGIQKKAVEQERKEEQDFCLEQEMMPKNMIPYNNAEW